MNRRGFLKSILVASAAPAIVKADSLMKLYVPKQEIILPDQNITGSADVYVSDFGQLKRIGSASFDFDETELNAVIKSVWEKGGSPTHFYYHNGKCNVLYS